MKVFLLLSLFAMGFAAEIRLYHNLGHVWHVLSCTLRMFTSEHLGRAQQKCPDGTSRVYCFVDPCMMAKCPAHPEVTCRANYCGGCNYEFYTPNGQKLGKASCHV